METLIQFDNTLKIDREFVVKPDGLHKFALEPTDIVIVDAERYRLVERTPKVGEEVVIVNCEEIPENNGKIATVVVNDEFTDGSFDVDIPSEIYGDTSFVDVECDNFYVLEPVASAKPADEHLTVDETQASPEVLDLLANLARRVTSLERQVDSLSAQLRDTQRNLETFAQQAEHNSEDIRTLDERTQVIDAIQRHYNGGAR